MFLKNQTLTKLQELSSILEKPLTFIDLETTGMVHERHFALIEIGLINITSTKIEEKSSLIDPKMKIPNYISEITHIYDHMVIGKPTFNHFAKYIGNIAQNNILCGYNSKTFDSKGLEKLLHNNNIFMKFNNQLDFRHIFLRARKTYDNIPGQHGSLTQACAHHKIFVDGQAHRAGYDISITAILANTLLHKYNYGILYKDVQKFSCNETKQKYLNYIKSNNLEIIT